MYHLCYRKRNCIVYSTVREIRYSEVCKMYLEILLLWQTKTAYWGVVQSLRFLSLLLIAATLPFGRLREFDLFLRHH